MNIKRYITGLLLVCFSVFLGHNLVPHHHHSEVLESPVATDCPFEHGDHQGHDHDSDANTNTDEHPLHCHAFNDVVFEKNATSLNQTWPVKVQVMLASSTILVPELQLGDPSKQITFLKPPRNSITDIGSRALRAPPAFA